MTDKKRGKMKKKKLANLLRRWADKLSPATTPTDQILAGAMLRQSIGEVKAIRAARHYSRRELQEIEHDPDLAAVIDMDARRRLINDMGLALYQAGAITFHTEAEACPDSHDVLIATCYAVVKK